MSSFSPRLYYWRLVGRILRLPAARFSTCVERNIAVPMADGVILRADRYSPAAAGAFPTVLIRSPYGRGSDLPLLARLLFGLIGRRIAERGYHALLQTTRGRNDSGGTFDPGMDEAADGQATLDWMEQQPWFDGTVGMLGTSYMGFAQWALATQAPKRVRAIVPAAAGSRLAPVVFADNAVALDTVLRWLLFVGGLERIRQRAWGAAARMLLPVLQRRNLQRAFAHLPLSDVCAVALGAAPDYMASWLKSCAGTSVERTDYATSVPNVSAPAHLVTGWYDFFLRETIADYAQLRSGGREPFLTIGPWRHSSPLLAWHSFREGMRWFEAYLKGDQAQLRAAPVRVYILEARRWLELREWPPLYTERHLYLQRGGRLTLEPAPAAPSGFCYDPATPTPALGGALLRAGRSRLDNRPLEARPDVLCYTSPPLAADLLVVGPVRAVIFVQSSSEYSDFFARLCDVWPNGRSLNVCDGLLRVTPGVGQRQADGTLRIEVLMWATAMLFRQGHRLRLQVSGGAHPRWSRNLGSSEPPLAGTRIVIVRQSVFHDPDHCSALILPQIEPNPLRFSSQDEVPNECIFRAR